MENATRIVERGSRVESSQIDLVFCRGNNFGRCSVDEIGLSDHCAVTCQVTKRVKAVGKKKIIMNEYTPEVIQWARSNAPSFTKHDSLDKLYGRLCDFLRNIDKMSRVQKTIKMSRQPKWYTPELHALKQKMLLARGQERKTLRNKYVASLRKSKSRVEMEKINVHGKSVWDIIRRPQSSGPTDICDKDGRLAHGEAAAEVLRDFFAEKQENLRKEPKKDKIKEVFKKHIMDSSHWDLGTVSSLNIYGLLDELKPKKSCGQDKISYFILKLFKFEVGPILTEIVNRSILECSFLEEWKIGRVIPLHKGKGNRTDPAAYHPITLTSAVGRIVEKAVQKQFKEILETRGVLSDSQYGFWAGRGTAECLVDCLDEVRTRMSDGSKVAMICADGTAAFDLLPQDQLAELVALTGVGPLMLKWMNDYFRDRRQYIDTGSGISSDWTVEVGSVQGGGLSPDYYNVTSVTQTLWLCYTKAFQFADDQGDVVHANTEEECNELLKRAAHDLCDWFDTAGLTVNPRKSELIGFNCMPDPVTMAGEEVTPVTKIKFLGLHIRSDLKWTDHVDHLCSVIRRAAGRIRMEGRHLSEKERRILYHSWIGGVIHANARAYITTLSEQEVKRLQTACNAGIRAVLGFPRRGVASVTEGRQRLKIPSVNQIIEQYRLMEAWEKRNWLRDLSRVGADTRRKTRGNVMVPDQRGVRSQLSKTVAALAWSRLPEGVRCVEERRRARRIVKEYVMRDG